MWSFIFNELFILVFFISFLNIVFVLHHVFKMMSIRAVVDD